jgi:hypothetical protein
MGMGKMTGKFRDSGKIPAVEIGTRLEKIPIWWEILPSGEKQNVFRCMETLVLPHSSYKLGFTPTPFVPVAY